MPAGKPDLADQVPAGKEGQLDELFYGDHPLDTR